MNEIIKLLENAGQLSIDSEQDRNAVLDRLQCLCKNKNIETLEDIAPKIICFLAPAEDEEKSNQDDKKDKEQEDEKQEITRSYVAL